MVAFVTTLLHLYVFAELTAGQMDVVEVQRCQHMPFKTMLQDGHATVL
jgi:hypothetical protein